MFPRVISLFVALACFLLVQNRAEAQKEQLFETIDSRNDQAWERARQIWKWAEPGYQEVKSSKLLAEDLKAAGFKITITLSLVWS